MTRRVLRGAIVLLAGAGALLPLPPIAVERVYATGVYPWLQQAVTPVSNVVPFAFFDTIVLGGVALLVWYCWRQIRAARAARRLGPVLAGARTIVVAAAAVYVVFLGIWGLNYRRVSMNERLVTSTERPASEAVVQLGLEAIEQMNVLHADAHAAGWDPQPWRDRELLTAFASAQRLLSDAPPARPGRLKWSVFGLYFRWASIDGMLAPFALEVIANPDLLPWERPFVAAHEWAHLAGYAHEAEANFLGWLTCIRGNASARYSGWLFLYWQVAGEVGRDGRARLDAALGDGPRADVLAIHERIRRGRLQFLQQASWRAYDHYLRANRVGEGVRSYSEVVNLILRTRFEDDWTPVRRNAASAHRESAQAPPHPSSSAASWR
jgi:hypothetical protein